jgi:hypothetical protein
MTTVRSSLPDPPLDRLVGAVQRVQREIVLARFLGKLAVDQGLRELRSRLVPTDHVSAPTDGASPGSSPTPAQPAEAQKAPQPPEASVAAEDVALALADYDHLSSAQIVAKLDGLEPDELAAIERHERAGRNRRTILGKLDQLDTS